MSFSYIKSVFPDFNFSTVFNDKLYNNLNNLSSPVQTNMQTSVESFENNQAFYNLPIPTQDIPKYNNINTHLPPIQPIHPIQSVKNGWMHESLDNTDNVDNRDISIKHDDYIQHILVCPGCKGILLKQFQVESDRMYKEEMMELVSYIIFALFILLLLDSIRKN